MFQLYAENPKSEARSVISAIHLVSPGIVYPGIETFLLPHWSKSAEWVSLTVQEIRCRIKTMKNRKWWIVGALTLVELFVCTVIILTLWAGRGVFTGVRFLYLTDTHVEETIERTFVTDGPAVVDLDADFGDVTVTGGTGEEVQVIARLSLWGTDEEDARHRVEVQMAQERDRIVIREVRPEIIYAFAVRDRGSRVDFEITVPPETSLQLVTSSGDLTVNDVIGTLELETDFGEIDVEDVSGPVSARSGSGDITLVGLDDAGVLQVETDFGDLVLRNVSADRLTARSGSGKIEVQDITAGDLTAHSGSGDIQGRVGALESVLDLETDFGNVTATGVVAASCRLASGSGSLTLDGCDGPLDLQTDFGDIEVRNASQAELTLKTGSGSISFHGSLHADGEHRVESDFGSISVVLPADAAFDLDAQTEFGSISTDFQVMMTEVQKRHLVGEVNGGGPPLLIRTGSSDITLERALNSSPE
jgi:DUF4097 and DUF4098 domain-containing protein YvlB